MSKFISRLIKFLTIPAVMIAVIVIAFPATPRAKTSLLFSKLDKDRLLENTPSPRLILIGGSNLSFGIDSSIIEEELGLNIINTSIHIRIGLLFLMDDIIDYVRPGDILIISPEYHQFFGRNAYGGEELLRIVLDVDRSKITLLDLNQWLNLIEFIPKYAISKIKLTEYFIKENPEIGIYERKSFNEYGDVYVHWAHKHSDFKPNPGIEGRFNDQVIQELLAFEDEVNEKGGALFITYPGLQELTYQIYAENIKQVEKELIDNGFYLLGTPERYKMPELLMYNSPYHLNREGVEYRTNLLIEDLRSTGVIRSE